MQEFEAIFFDFDGVLIDSEPLHFACWKEVLAPLGVHLDWETYRAECIGVDDRVMLEIFGRRCDPPAELQRLWALYPSKRDRFQKMTAERPDLFAPELIQSLKFLADRYKLAVVTSSGRAEVEPLLAGAGIREFFGALVCGDEVCRHKPAPEPYLLAAARLDVRRALVLEDSDAGMESARAAGFEALCITHPGRTLALLQERLQKVSVADCEL